MGGVVRRFRDATRETSCAGKVRYLTQSVALAAATKIEARNRRFHGRHSKLILNTYRCGFCRTWHLTHRRK